MLSMENYDLCGECFEIVCERTFLSIPFRYNISTDDYDPWFTDSNSNEDL